MLRPLHFAIRVAVARIDAVRFLALDPLGCILDRQDAEYDHACTRETSTKDLGDRANPVRHVAWRGVYTEVPLHSADGTKLHYAYGGYNAMVKGDLIAYPAPGSNARLVVCWQRISSGGAVS